MPNIEIYWRQLKLAVIPFICQLSELRIIKIKAISMTRLKSSYPIIELKLLVLSYIILH